MQRNQWKAAAAQLLDHWARSGISQVPIGTTAAQAWLDRHSNAVFEAETKPAIVATQSEASSAAAQALASNAVQAVSPSAVTAVAAKAPSAESAPLQVHESESEFQLTPRPTARKSSSSLIGAGESWQTSALDLSQRQSVFASLNEQVIACRKCEDIVCRRQRTVFGVGDLNAKVVMFGEAPGADEDRIGEPFVGAAGQLLDKILTASGLKRPEVYIMNALKCRPPGNRTPTETEIENCRPFFETQLETIQPDYIVCWGAVAVRSVLRSTESVGRLRGRFHAFRGAKVLVTYHPAYLLRNPDAKKLTWEDMKMLMRELGIPIPGQR